MRLRLRTFLIPLTVGLLVTGSAVGADAATQPPWAPVSRARIRPGVQTRTSQGQCTANFVFYDATAVYIGQSAHCASTDGPTQTNGCEAGSLPLGAPVEVSGAERPGRIVYSSWLAMQAVGEDDSDRCLYNDFALIRLDRADWDDVNPTVPYWGGPNGLSDRTSGGQKVHSYGNSSLRGGLSTLSPKEGYSLGQEARGWTHNVYTLTPGIPGDSGSAFLDSAGRAVGVLSTIHLLPVIASNGVSDLARMLQYMEAHSSLRVTLALGTQPFKPGLLPRAGRP